MTSTNDGKDVKSNQTSGQKIKTYYIELYQSLESRLNGECTSEEQTQQVCEAWRRIYSFCNHSAPTTHPHLLTWLQRHTAHTLLQSKWQTQEMKELHTLLNSAIDEFIQDCKDTIVKRNGESPPWEVQLLQRAEWFKTILPNPWGHPVLKALLDNEGSPTDQQILEWLKEERGVMFVTRLRQMATSKCLDLALKLTTAVMSRVRDCTTLVPDADQIEDVTENTESSSKSSFASVLRNEAGFTKDVWELLADIEFMLLHKANHRSSCIDLAKRVPFKDAFHLIERLAERQTSKKDKKLWKNSKEVAKLIAQVVIARCMVVPSCRGGVRRVLFRSAHSLSRLMSAAELSAACVALAAPAATARHLHTLAAAAHAQLKEERTSFLCELYVRAITTGMNELEKLKLDPLMESEARAAEQSLSTWLNQLGTVLSTSDRLRCECVLTAFSVHPTPVMYDKVREAPHLPFALKDPHEIMDKETSSEFGSWATDSRTQTNLVKTSETLKLKKTQKQANVLSTAILNEGERIGLETDLCQDLAVLISGPRVKTLSWDVEREVLLENCRTYMERTHGGTKALTTELKYLNLDPRSFQHLPEEEDDESDIYYGIEKGYEHLVETQEAHCPDIWQDAFFESSSSSSYHSEQSTKARRRKKKIKRQIHSTEEELDPLSVEAFTSSKLERDVPEVKERSKLKKSSKESSKNVGKKHSHDSSIKGNEECILKLNNSQSKAIQDERNLKRENKKEKRRERKDSKKRNKLEEPRLDTLNVRPGGLSHLIGLKVGKSSQNHLPIRSSHDEIALNNVLDSVSSSLADTLGGVSNVVYDGLYSMDEMKLKTNTNRVEQISNNMYNDHKVKNDSNLQSPSDNILNPYAGKDVKEKIQKLIILRRQKNEDQNKKTIPNAINYNTQITNTNAIVDDEHISPKIVSVPEIPTTFISKSKTNERLNEPYQVDQILREYNSKIADEQNAYKLHSLNTPPINPVAKLETPSQKAFEEFIKSHSKQQACFSSTVRSQPKSQELAKNSNQSISKSSKKFDQTSTKTSKASIKSVLMALNHTSSKRTTGESQMMKKDNKGPVPSVAYDPTQKHFQNFIKELQQSINPASDGQMIEANCDKTSAYSTAKQTKMADNVPNTFARLSYLHKNKQIEKKLKEQETRVKKLVPTRVQNDLEKILPRHLQSRGEIIIHRISKHDTNEGEKLNITNSKIQSPTLPASKISTNHPNMIKALTSNTTNNYSTITPENNVTMKSNGNNQFIQSQPSRNATDFVNRVETKVNSNQLANTTKESESNMPYKHRLTSGIKNYEVKIPTKINLASAIPTSLSERDQADLLLLLRQQNKLNASVSSNGSYDLLNFKHSIGASLINPQQCTSKCSEQQHLSSVINASKLSELSEQKSASFVDRHNNNSSLIQRKKIHSIKEELEAELNPLRSVGKTNYMEINKIQQNSLKFNHNYINECNNRMPKEKFVESKQDPLNLGSTSRHDVHVTDKIIPKSYDEKEDSPKTGDRNLTNKVPVIRNQSGNISIIDSKVKASYIGKHKMTPDSTNINKKPDWQSVFNDLLKHKTPSRGPNALEKALNNVSIENHQVQTDKGNISSSSLEKTNEVCKNVTNNKDNQNSIPRTNKPTVKIPSACKSNTNTRKINAKRTPKIEDKPVMQDDPFISGIPNSDYDLLEELMDDDLRQEIGELSDDESYCPLDLYTQKEKDNLSQNNGIISQNIQIAQQPGTKSTHNSVIKCTDPSRVIITKSLKSSNSSLALESKPHISSNEIIMKNVRISKTIKKPNVPNNKPDIIAKSNNGNRRSKSGADVALQKNLIRVQQLPPESTRKPISSLFDTAQPNTSKLVKDKPIHTVDPKRVIISPVPTAAKSLQGVGLASPNMYDQFSQYQKPGSSNIYTINKNQMTATPKITILHTTQIAAPVAPVFGNNLKSEPDKNTVRKTTISNPLNENKLESISTKNKSNEASTEGVDNLFNENKTKLSINKPLYVNTLNNKDEKKNISAIEQVHNEKNKISSTYCDLIQRDEANTNINPKDRNRLEIIDLPEIILPKSKSKEFEGQLKNENRNILSNFDEKQDDTKLEQIPSQKAETVEYLNVQNQGDQKSSVHLPLNDDNIPNSLKQSVLVKTDIKDNNRNKIDNVSQEKLKYKELKQEQLITNKNGSLKSKIEKDYTINSTITAKTEIDISTDKTPKNASEETQFELVNERVKLKRLDILNRKIEHQCNLKPIALPYESIATKDKNVEHIKKHSVSKRKNTESTPNSLCIKSGIKTRNQIKSDPPSSQTNESSISNIKDTFSENFSKIMQKCATSNVSNQQKRKSSDVTNKQKESNSDKTKKTKLNDIKKDTVEESNVKLSDLKTLTTTHVEKLPTVATLVDIDSNVNSSAPLTCLQNFDSQDVAVTTTKENIIVVSSQQVTVKKLKTMAARIVNETKTASILNNSNILQPITSKVVSDIKGMKTQTQSSDQVNLTASDTNNAVKNRTDARNASTHIGNVHTKCIKDKVKIKDYTIKVPTKNLYPDQTQKSKATKTVKDTSTILKDKSSFDYFKNQIQLEEMPRNPTDAPFKRLIRIKLPNGSVFRVTISGKLNVDVDSLFADPQIKSILLKNMNSNKKCTLSIKQFSKDKEKMKINQIMYAKTINSSETINLISDDEDEERHKVTMKTEFGNFTVFAHDSDSLKKHQLQLSKQCTVQLQNIDFTSKIDRHNDALHSSKLLVTSLNNSIENLSTHKADADVIELDDSSNDNTSGVNNGQHPKQPSISNINLDILSNSKIQGLQKDNDNTREPQILMCSETLNNKSDQQKIAEDESITKQTKIENAYVLQKTLNENEVKPKVLNIDNVILEKSKTTKCYINLERCDHLLSKKSHDSDKSDLQNHNANEVECYSPELQRSGSFSILNNYENDSDPVHTEFIDYQVSSDIKCYSDWFLTKSVMNELETQLNCKIISLRCNKICTEELAADSSTDSECDFEITSNKVQREVLTLSSILANYFARTTILNHMEPLVNKNNAFSHTLKRKLDHTSEHDAVSNKLYKIVSKENQFGPGDLRLFNNDTDLQENIHKKIETDSNQYLLHSNLKDKFESYSISPKIYPVTFETKNDQLQQVPYLPEDNKCPYYMERKTLSPVNECRTMTLARRKKSVSDDETLNNSRDIDHKIYDESKNISSHRFNLRDITDKITSNVEPFESESIVENTTKTTLAPSILINSLDEFREDTTGNIENTTHMKSMDSHKNNVIENITLSTDRTSNTDNDLFFPQNLGILKFEDIVISSKDTVRDVKNSALIRKCDKNGDDMSVCSSFPDDERNKESTTSNIPSESQYACASKCDTSASSEILGLKIEKENCELIHNNMLMPLVNFTRELRSTVEDFINVERLCSGTNLQKKESKESFKGEHTQDIQNKDIVSDEIILEDNVNLIISSEVIDTNIVAKDLILNTTRDDEGEFSITCSIQKAIDENRESLQLQKINSSLPSKILAEVPVDVTLINEDEKNNQEHIKVLTENKESIQLRQMKISSNYNKLTELPSYITSGNNEAKLNLSRPIAKLDMNKEPILPRNINISFDSNKLTEVPQRVQLEKEFNLAQSIEKLAVNKEHFQLRKSNISSPPKEAPSDVTLVYKADSELVLKGSAYQDPVVGTCYVFPICRKISCDMRVNENNLEILESYNNKVYLNDNLQVRIPTKTYSKGSLKRRHDHFDTKNIEKRYRKSKNIDYSKITVTAMAESSYKREFSQLMNYLRSIKFSFAQPFHKEHIEVHNLIEAWPRTEPIQFKRNEFHDDTKLFCGNEDKKGNQYYDPFQQTLAEEIAYAQQGSQYDEIQIDENNFHMGFGERSDRVIQCPMYRNTLSKVSAATLSDVKHFQPHTTEYCNKYNKNYVDKDHLETTQRLISCFRLKDKVRTFFRKTSVELNNCWIRDNLKDKRNFKNMENAHTETDLSDFYNFEYFEAPFVESLVNVVQVGQLAVNATAQNPVTCDPRVTQVTDASPSQCSIENSPRDDSQPGMKAEYTELTTADLSLPLVREYERHQPSNITQHENHGQTLTDENIPIETEVSSIVKIEINDEVLDNEESVFDGKEKNFQNLVSNHKHNSAYSFENNSSTEIESRGTSNTDSLDNSHSQNGDQNGTVEKTDQIAHAMNAAGIATNAHTNNVELHDMSQVPDNHKPESINIKQTSNNYSKTTPINAMALQQAFAHILPPPLNRLKSADGNHQSSSSPPVLHIVQGKNSTVNHLTLVDNTQQSVINTPNQTQVLHIVHNKSASNSNVSGSQANSYTGLSLVDGGMQQGGNQLLHIVNTGNQKAANSGQLLKRVNLVTNIGNGHGTGEQKMVQFVCKSADGKSIQLNAQHQRGMVLRLQPIESTQVPNNTTKADSRNESSNSENNIGNSNESNRNHQEIKSRSVYEENYAKFIQNSNKSPIPEKSTSLPKFNQAFGKPIFQDDGQKTSDGSDNNSHLAPINPVNENTECHRENTINIDQMNAPPLLLRKSAQSATQQTPPNIIHQIKQPMNVQTMHGGVIYTRQIPVNIGGGQTINLITVPSTELVDESSNKQNVNQTEAEPSIIKLVPQNQTSGSDMLTADENSSQVSNEPQPSSQSQPVLTQMRIKLPMLSKPSQMISGTRVVRPSFFQIQRNVIGGTNQPVYQQLVLTAAPPLGQQTIRLPQPQTNKFAKLPSENQPTQESQMSSSTLEQLREFDMVLEQVKERSTVQPAPKNETFTKLHTSTSDSSEATSSSNSSTESTQQVLYKIGNNPSLNVAYVNRKVPVTTSTVTNVTRSPETSSVADTPSSSVQSQVVVQGASENTQVNEVSPVPQNKPVKSSSKSKSRPKSSSQPSTSVKVNSVAPKPSTQKPFEDEQTTQRILYILAEYKEQVENSPDKDKPAPRRRSNPPSLPGSSKRKKSCSGSRRQGRDMSPIHGEDTCRTIGSEDSSCGTSQGDCNESCLDSHSPQDSPRKVPKKINFEPELTAIQQPQPHRNLIVADGQTITVARTASGKPTTAVLMPANYILPVSMVKSGQQIAIVTNRGPKILTVGGDGGGNAVLLQRLIGPGLKPVLARPGVRHVRLPAAALHNLQAFTLGSSLSTHPDSTANLVTATNPPELVNVRSHSTSWVEREVQESKPEQPPRPESSEPWNLTSDPQDYSYEEIVRSDNMDRTVLDAIQERYSPDMEAHRIFDKMFDIDSKKSFIVDSQDDSPRCGYDIDASDCDDKSYQQVVHRKDGTTQKHHRLTHVSAAALRHRYAILEHELRLQKSLSEECEDLGVDSPSASDLFPEAELLFASSPAHDAPHHSHTPQPSIINQSNVPQVDTIDDQIATDQLINTSDVPDEEDISMALGLDADMVTVSEDGATITLDPHEFAKSHPNTTFHREPTDESELQPFTIANVKGRHMTSTIFHATRAPATVLVTAPQSTVISQTHQDSLPHILKYTHTDIHTQPNVSTVLVKDNSKFDNVLNDSRELHLSNTASTIIHASSNATQVIRRVYYDDDNREQRFLVNDSGVMMDDVKLTDNSRDVTLESIADDDGRSTPERNSEIFWESTASERSESRRPLDFSSDSDKCCKSPFEETNSTDSGGLGTHLMRLDSVIKEARGIERSCSADNSSADDSHPPLRTYPPKRSYHHTDGEMESVSGKTRAGGTPDLESRRRASNRGVVKRGCHCCNGSPTPSRPKKPRPRKPNIEFNN